MRTDRPPARQPSGWLSISVELVEGAGDRFWPRPGRRFAASPDHSFAQLATAIDEAFARWDLSHLHEFRLGGGSRIGIPDRDLDDDVVDERRTRLSRLRLGEQFVYVFDLGDEWKHLCTVEPDPIDPLEILGVVPRSPLPHFGWGTIPDQYGRRWAEDDGESPPPRDPARRDLPPLEPGWGSSAGRADH